MSEMEQIRGFLRAVRRRAFLEAGLRAGALTVAALLGALYVLSLFAVRIGPAGFWPTVTVVVLSVLTVTGLVLWAGCAAARRRS